MYAGHVLHSIEDARGAHKDYIGNPLGHGLAGHAPDRIVGDQTFVDVSNEVLQFLKKGHAKLTDQQINDLIDAILRECGTEGFDVKKLTIIRPGGGGSAFGGGPLGSGSGGDLGCGGLGCLAWLHKFGWVVTAGLPEIKDF